MIIIFLTQIFFITLQLFFYLEIDYSHNPLYYVLFNVIIYCFFVFDDLVFINTSYYYQGLTVKRREDNIRKYFDKYFVNDIITIGSVCLAKMFPIYS